MRKIYPALLFLVLGSCTNTGRQTQIAAEEERIPYDYFVPEDHQQILEQIRNDILYSKLLEDSTLIAEEALEDAGRNVFDRVVYGKLSEENKMLLSSIRTQVVRFLRSYPDVALEAVKTRIPPETETDDEQIPELIVKYTIRKKLEPPMLTVMELLSQGLDYYVYEYQCANYPKIDPFTFERYCETYRVRFNFRNGYYTSYGHL